MKDNDKPRFAELMIEMGIASGVPVSKTIMRVYWKHLKSYKLEFVEKGINNAINGNSYKMLPLIGTIIKNMDN
jgi:hypothetical protein